MMRMEQNILIRNEIGRRKREEKEDEDLGRADMSDKKTMLYTLGRLTIIIKFQTGTEMVDNGCKKI